MCPGTAGASLSDVADHQVVTASPKVSLNLVDHQWSGITALEGCLGREEGGRALESCKRRVGKGEPAEAEQE